MSSVLIVDDSPTIRSIIRAYLEITTSFRVCGEAGNGTTAIERAQALKPDVVLLDLVMPQVNGAQAAPIIKRLLPDTKIILFSFLTDVPSNSLAEAVGVDAVLSKPTDLTGIVEAIRKVTSRIVS